MKRIAIIPARGGSKRIPNKNIRDFCGKPIMAYVLKMIRASKMFDVVHVSTDSDAINDVAIELGFEPDFSRPGELADDMTPIMPVLKYVAEEYEKRGQLFDQIWLFMPTSPFLEVKDIIEADELFLQAGGNAPLLGVSEYPAPIELAFNRSEDGRLTPVSPGMFAVRSQDLKPKYFDVGSFAVFPPRLVLESKDSGSDAEFISQVLPKYKAIDIDTKDDWLLAEALYRGMYAVNKGIS